MARDGGRERLFRRGWQGPQAYASHLGKGKRHGDNLRRRRDGVHHDRRHVDAHRPVGVEGAEIDESPGDCRRQRAIYLRGICRQDEKTLDDMQRPHNALRPQLREMAQRTSAGEWAGGGGEKRVPRQGGDDLDRPRPSGGGEGRCRRRRHTF